MCYQLKLRRKPDKRLKIRTKGRITVNVTWEEMHMLEYIVDQLNTTKSKFMSNLIKQLHKQFKENPPKEGEEAFELEEGKV